MNSVELRGLAKAQGAFQLGELSFAVPEGYITGFIGPNGAGKTSTIKAILGLNRPDSGEILLFGEPLEQGGQSRNGEIGVVMDAPFFVEDWTAAELQRVLAPFYRAWDGAHYASLLARFGLDPRKKIKELSRGMKVKLMLSVAFSHGARLLLLDEPTSGLDPLTRDELGEILGEFMQEEGRSVLFSTHIGSDLERIADHIVFLLEGRLLFSGPKEELLGGYRRVTGGVKALSRALRAQIIGLREHGVGFEGLIPSGAAKDLGGELLAEPASLEEIFVFLGRGKQGHAE
ncbi:MAG: ABC transporter ATP-binding protein [Christensenellaceae bacterium]|jgi:ABC-2 type transport system ATP-binding protein|nr:ABC transporter ATP-binding protein [Christensenellaceae bacterium]